MATSKLTKGIELHGNSIRIVFSYRNRRCREILKGLEPTKANIKFAANKRAAIIHEIGIGKFNYADHFPDSKNARLYSGPATERRTVSEGIDTWLAVKKGKIALSTYGSYKSKANSHIKPAFGNRYISELTKTEIDTWIAVDLHHLANKTINEIMIILRGVMKDAKADRVIKDSPTDLIDNLEVYTEPPDPFTREEINRFLATPTKRTNEINMMKFGIWTGLRISELIALCWEDVDLKKRVVRIRRANVKSHWKITKTEKSERDVELIEPAMDALKQAMSESYALPAISIEVIQRDNKTIKVEHLRPVFVNSNSHTHHANDGMVRDRFWKTHLRKAKVRYRGPNHARHTFASQLLSTGMISKDWIAKQMGHTSTKMLDRHYAKWIPEDAPPMAAMVNKILGFENEKPDQKAPNTPQGKSTVNLMN